MKENKDLRDFIQYCLREDIGDGDHSSLSCIPAGSYGKAHLLIKEEGILAGVRIAERVFREVDRSLKMDPIICDGSEIKPGEIAFYVEGSCLSILQSERLVLNIMQRMSGIATSTRSYVTKLKGLRTRILDTRKTAPGMRALEKEAVRLGGGKNHRMGLYDMIMLKDNHIDFAGGIRETVERCNGYIEKRGVPMKVEIEARNLLDVEEIISVGKVDRIMLDNFTVENTRTAVNMIARRFETESSGGINLDNIRDYAECGVDYVSVGAITHHLNSLDMSLKVIRD